MQNIIPQKITQFKERVEKSAFISLNSFKLKLLENDKEGQLDIDYSYDNLYNEFGYLLEESFKEIINIYKFVFYGRLEVDSFYSEIEINLEKISSGLSLINYDDGLWFEGQSEEEKALWKTFRSFDIRPEIGDGKMAVFSIQEGVSPPNEPAIYYIDRAKAFKTNLTFVQYYETVLDMMGIADWQLLFTDVSWNDPQVEDYYPELKAAIEALAKAFPDKDYKKYFDLLEARWV